MYFMENYYHWRGEIRLNFDKYINKLDIICFEGVLELAVSKECVIASLFAVI